MSLNTLPRALPRTHPGEFLNEIVLPGAKLSKTEVARHLGVSRQTLYDVLNMKQPVTAGIAVRLGKLFGNGGAFWLNMQAAYDIETAETELAEIVAKIPTVEAA